MKKSPLSTPSGPNRPRHAPYKWNSPENAWKKGYPPTNSGYQCPPERDNTQQPSGNDFIPLNMSTPETQYKDNRNWHSPRGRRNNSSLDSRGYNHRNSYGSPRMNNSGNANPRCNYRNNYNTSSGSGSYSSYSPYKQPFKPFYKQGKGEKGAHRRVHISQYLDIPSCLEDPWENLMRKLDNSRDTSNDEVPREERSPKLELGDDSREKAEGKLPSDVDLRNSLCSEGSKVDSSTDATIGEDTLNVSQPSKADSSVDLEISGLCFSQDSVNESTSNIDDQAPATTEEKDKTVVEPTTDTDEKNI